MAEYQQSPLSQFPQNTVFMPDTGGQGHEIKPKKSAATKRIVIVAVIVIVIIACVPIVSALLTPSKNSLESGVFAVEGHEYTLGKTKYAQLVADGFSVRPDLASSHILY